MVTVKGLEVLEAAVVEEGLGHEGEEKEGEAEVCEE